MPKKGKSSSGGSLSVLLIAIVVLVAVAAVTFTIYYRSESGKGTISYHTALYKWNRDDLAKKLD